MSATSSTPLSSAQCDKAYTQTEISATTYGSLATTYGSVEATYGSLIVEANKRYLNALQELSQLYTKNIKHIRSSESINLEKKINDMREECKKIIQEYEAEKKKIATEEIKLLSDDIPDIEKEYKNAVLKAAENDDNLKKANDNFHSSKIRRMISEAILYPSASVERAAAHVKVMKYLKDEAMCLIDNHPRIRTTVIHKIKELSEEKDYPELIKAVNDLEAEILKRHPPAASSADASSNTATITVPLVAPTPLPSAPVHVRHSSRLAKKARVNYSEIDKE